MLMPIDVINKETNMIRRIAGDFTRHPQQINKLLEADAEVIRLNSHEEYTVLKTDGIHEEIREKLYVDPYLIGWMTVTAPVSDIAAVGAVPSGILLSLTLMKHFKEDWMNKFKAGINDACSSYNIHVLGGDTNFDDRVSINATVIAHIKSSHPLFRTGIQKGDYLYATARLGTGNAYAYSRYFNEALKIDYRPLARLAESRLIKEFATACTDTSDGLFPALAVLSEINKVGFSLDVSLQQILSEEASIIYQYSNLPAWSLLAGPHGEYELLFTIPQRKHDDFKAFCLREEWNALYIGRVTSDMNIDFLSDGMHVRCHPATIANLFYESGGNVSAYFKLLMKQHQNWKEN
ncbi:MAG: thiamine-phosphate kinase [Chitinophagaceae bacterium]